ncbi:non-hemolytic phospholipase C precursor [Cordyceps javanica]|uniref:Non-hemolytic phospholipase C n=1 Tax=Cordyceps javanica TaxID=43265 RepID=A0A545VKX9_9HYPO|nr:non-hemolytic phospholipase C precursor [Cordyceps javanica]TQW02379.1 non-hemolytic phospholipase C precursor [Cordyceps javanica]
MLYSSLTLTLVASAMGVQAGSLKDIKHIILFMQENRSFDHASYFGTMAGVRNFADPNVKKNDGVPVTKQAIKGTKNGVNSLSPWHINYLGGDWKEATQCMNGGSNGWDAMHGAWNHGRGDAWVTSDTDYNMGYFKREDVPTHFDIAEGWTVMDNSHQSILGVTDPNRITWMSGTVNTKGSPTNPDGSGGNILSNRASPGCDSPGNNCFPFTWKTTPEYLEDAGISWRVWQDFDNFEDNMLAYFKQYQDTPQGGALRDKGISFPGLDAFYDACANGTLPQVSWIIGPAEQSEHPPQMPVDGAWLQRNVVEAVINSPLYSSTALVISYDEQGGWADHVVPPVAPKDAAGEWITDPFDSGRGTVPIGPGPRIPRYIISPWTRGGNVFAETGDHTSDIMFIEAWAQANGYDVKNQGITPWRRAHMTNMVNAFDFNNPDYSLPSITSVRTPEALDDDNWSGNLTLGSLTGPWVGPSKCLAGYAHGNYPAVPYGKENANQDMNGLVEDGYKRIRGAITEGRYITIETDGMGLGRTAKDDKGVVGIAATDKHEDASQRWIITNSDGDRFGKSFFIQSASDGSFITSSGGLAKDQGQAQAFIFEYEPESATYTIRRAGAGSGQYVSIGKRANKKRGVKKCRDIGEVNFAGSKTSFKIYGVNYRS